MRIPAEEVKSMLAEWSDGTVKAVFAYRKGLLSVALTGTLIEIPPDRVCIRTGPLPTDNFVIFSLTGCVFEYGDSRKLTEAGRGMTGEHFRSALTILFPPLLENLELMERVNLYRIN